MTTKSDPIKRFIRSPAKDRIASLHRLRYNAGMTRLIAILLVLAAPIAQRTTPGLTDGLTLDGATPIIANDRVTVWDFTWTRGIPGVLELQTSDSIWISVSPSIGDVRYWAKGAPRRAERTIGSPIRMVAVDLKEHPSVVARNT